MCTRPTRGPEQTRTFGDGGGARGSKSHPARLCVQRQGAKLRSQLREGLVVITWGGVGDVK
jgi:hypothetical protein